LKSNRSRSLKMGRIDRSYSRACVTITSSGVCFVSKQLASTSFRRQVFSTLLVQRWRGSSGNVRLSNLLISSCWVVVKHLTKFCIMAYLRNCLIRIYLYHLYVYCINGTITYNALSDRKKNIVGESFLVKCGVRQGEWEFYLHIYLLC